MYSQMTVPNRRSRREEFCASRTCDKNKNQNRRHAFQRADKQISKFANPGPAWHQQSQYDANHQTNQNAKNQAGTVVASNELQTPIFNGIA